ncbi:MAG: tetratricopeptide repeat protein [Bacteroidales bacterium]|nr:tetratricopeptide repeat protein [Bacteroidales bacterium]
MREKIENLSKKHLKLLTQLSVFGNESTSIALFIDYFGLHDEQEKNIILEVIYDLSTEGLVKLSQEKFEVMPDVQDFLFEKYPPNVNNCRVFIEFYMDMLHPPMLDTLPPEEEQMLHKVLSRITGYSSELAMLTDFYAQYLLSEKDYKSSVNFFQLALEIQSKANPSDVLMCNFYNHLAESYLANKDYDKAIDVTFKSVHLAYNLQRKDMIVLVYSFSLISTIYFRQKSYDLSYEYSLKAIEIAKEKEFDDLLLANLYYEASISATKAKDSVGAVDFIAKSYKTLMKLPSNSRDSRLLEKINLHQQYLSLLKKIDNSFLRYFKSYYIYIVLFIVVLLIVFLLSI